MQFAALPFVRDGRGNRLARYKIEQEGADWLLYLLGPREVAWQAKWMLEPLASEWFNLTRDPTKEWTQRIRIHGPLPDEVKGTLDLLTEVVTLPVRAHLDIAIALDLYKTVVPDVDPMKWPNTRAGEMVSRAKYYEDDDAYRSLVAALAGVASRHSVYAAADFVCSVPGHDTTRTSIGEHLAADVAKRLGKPLVAPRAARERRPAAKDRDEFEKRMSLDAEFSFEPGSVANRIILIVDDVYRTGDTMAAVAHAAKRGGADRVLGLAGAKTLRN